MKHLPFIATLLVATISASHAETTTAEQAERAIREGMPQAAIAPLQQALRQAPAGEKHGLGLLLARAQLAAGRPADALQTLDRSCDRDAPATNLLRAASFAAQGSLENAAKLAEPLAADNPEAALLLARIRFEQGDRAAARALLPASVEALPSDPNVLRLLLDVELGGENPSAAEPLIAAARDQSLLPAAELDIALGRLRLAADQASEASEIFREVLARPDLPAPVRDNARLGLARSLVALGVDARARDVLREGMTDSPDALTMRETIDQWIALEQKLGNDPSADLRVWAAEAGSRRALEAGLRLARLDLDGKNLESAVALLEKIATEPDIAPEDLVRTRLLLAEARIVSGQTDAALEILDSIDVDANAFRLSELRGRAFAAAGRNRQAYEAFAAALTHAATPGEASAAATNGFLCALAMGDLKLARGSLEQIREAAPDSPDLVRWSFLLAAAEAREGQIDALGTLARRSPSADYSFQAKLALAEWRLGRGEAAAAERILRTAAEEAETPPQAAALAAAEIFAADNAASQSREDLVASCREFLAAYPDTPEATDISFKLGELHARAGEHTAAEGVFAELAQNLTDPASANLAKFLAAQSAARSMSAEGSARALAGFEEIAQSTSPLRHRARFEQATLLLRDRRFDDALKIYDGLLAGEPPADVRHAARMEKGDTLVALGAEKPDKFAEAAAVYADIASDETSPADWRDQAACKRAAALARAGQSEAALAAYREVLSRPPGRKADYFWFYKAGLEAGRLLEEQQDWPAAIAVYDLMASADGPQSEEIEQRSRRLRLEHFIWEN